MRRLTEEEFLERLKYISIPTEPFCLKRAVRVFKYSVIKKAILKNGKNKSRAAKFVGISRILLQWLLKHKPGYLD